MLEDFLEEEPLELGLEGQVDLERGRERTTGDAQRQKQREGGKEDPGKPNQRVSQGLIKRSSPKPSIPQACRWF